MVQRLELSPEVDAWRARCPLRLWLNTRPRGAFHEIQKACKMRSRQGVYAWMEGTALPRPERRRVIQSITQITEEEWLKWWAKRPRE